MQEAERVHLKEYLEPGSPILAQAKMSISELPKETRDKLADKGYTEEEWENMGQAEKERVLECLLV